MGPQKAAVRCRGHGASVLPPNCADDCLITDTARDHIPPHMPDVEREKSSDGMFFCEYLPVWALLALPSRMPPNGFAQTLVRLSVVKFDRKHVDWR